MNKSTVDRIERWKAQQAKLNVRIQLAEARLKVAERKKDTQRKILMGAYLLDQALKNNELNQLASSMKAFLTRDSDRELFENWPILLAQVPNKDKDSASE